jgi:hypothetical protein
MFTIKHVLFFCLLTVSFAAFGQVPQAVNYQAIIRDDTGNPVSEQTISLRLSVRSESATGPIVYSESHIVTTTAGGLINLAIGQGIILTGTMSEVNWLEYPKYLEVEVDLAAGSNYTVMGTSQLVSVPYSFASNG